MKMIRKIIKKWAKQRKLNNQSSIFIRKHSESPWEHVGNFKSEREAKKVYDSQIKLGVHHASIIRRDKVVNRNYNKKSPFNKYSLCELKGMPPSKIYRGLSEGWIDKDTIPDEIWQDIFPDSKPGDYDNIGEEELEMYDNL